MSCSLKARRVYFGIDTMTYGARPFHTVGTPDVKHNDSSTVTNCPDPLLWKNVCLVTFLVKYQPLASFARTRDNLEVFYFCYRQRFVKWSVLYILVRRVVYFWIYLPLLKIFSLAPRIGSKDLRKQLNVLNLRVIAQAMHSKLNGY